MYDFESEIHPDQATAKAAGVGRPRALMLLELLRFTGELAASHAVGLISLRRLSHVGMVVDRLCQDPPDWHEFGWRNTFARTWGRA